MYLMFRKKLSLLDSNYFRDIFALFLRSHFRRLIVIVILKVINRRWTYMGYITGIMRFVKLLMEVIKEFIRLVTMF